MDITIRGLLNTGCNVALAATVAGCTTLADSPDQCTSCATISQQLLELDRAREAGQISAEEYARLRKGIVGQDVGGSSLAPGTPLNDAVRTMTPAAR